MANSAQARDLAPLLAAVLLLVGCTSSPASPYGAATPTSSSPPVPTTPGAPALPSLASFRAAPSDRFLVDIHDITGGHPFKGARSAEPHQGAHVLFDNAEGAWPRHGTAPFDYPPIYAVADGVVARIDTSYKVGANDRYGVDLAVARDGATTWIFSYSIEPFVPEPSPGFYQKFILVKEGEHVTKGKVIAYFFDPKISGGPHIHFHLRPDTGAGGGARFAAPAIFAPPIVQTFHDAWGQQGSDEGAPMDACMGWKLVADENPFGTGSVDCL